MLDFAGVMICWNFQQFFQQTILAVLCSAQGGNEKFCHSGVFLEQTHHLCRFIFCAFGVRYSLFADLKKVLIHLLGQTPAIFGVHVGVEVCDHPGLCVACITLDSLDVTSADL